MEGIIKEIENMVEAQARKFINESETYREARQKARSKSLGFRYGELGRQIDLAVLEKIEHEAMTQSVNYVPSTFKPSEELTATIEIDSESLIGEMKKYIKENLKNT